MEQIELFVNPPEEKDDHLQDLDCVLVKEESGYRLVHSYYRDSRVGKVITAEEALEALSFIATFNLYAVVAFNENLTLPRRKH